MTAIITVIGIIAGIACMCLLLSSPAPARQDEE